MSKPKDLREKKELKNMYLVRIMTFIAFALVALLAINVIMNYLEVIFAYAFGSLKTLKDMQTPGTVDLGFKAWYLITVADPMPVWVPWVATAALVIFKGWWVVKSVEQLIKNNKLDYAYDDIEGSSAWATTEEITRVLTAVPKNNIESAKKGGIILYEDKKNYYIDDSTSHSFIVGKTRSGKGMIFVLPSIRIIAKSQEKPSMVVLDPKLENYEYMYQTLKEAGYTIWILNFRDPEKGMSCSDLASIIREYKIAMETDPDDRDFSRTSDRVSELAKTLTANPKSDPIWPDSAQSLLEALIYYLLDLGYNNGTIDSLNMYTVRLFLLAKGAKELPTEDGKGKTTALNVIMENLPDEHPAKSAYGSSKFAEGEMRSSIYSTLSSNLDIYKDTGIARMTTMRPDEPIDFQELGKATKPIALFLGIPDDRENRHKMATTYISQIYTELADLAQHSKRNLLPRRVIIIGDEIGTLPAIQSFDNKLQVSLGRGIIWYLFAQNLAQMNKNYGDNESLIIRDSASNFIYILSADLKTNKDVSEMLGDATKAYATTTGDRGSILEANHIQTHLKPRRLFTHDELRMLEEGECIIIKDRMHPIHANLTPFYNLGIERTSIEDTEYTVAAKLPVKKLLMEYEDKDNPLEKIVLMKKHQKSVKKEPQKAPAKVKPEKKENSALAGQRLKISLAINAASKGQYLAAVEKGNKKLAHAIALEQCELGSISKEDFVIIQDFLRENDDADPETVAPGSEEQNVRELPAEAELVLKSYKLSPEFQLAIRDGNYDRSITILKELSDIGALTAKETETMISSVIKFQKDGE